MMIDLRLGFSPCPNDTFIFNALVNGLVTDPDLRFHERLEDVETLNALVLEGALDVSKVSFHLMGHARENYALLRSGGALGRGCGPLVVSRDVESPQDLRGRTIAIPGKFTTAALLLRLFDPALTNLVVMPFHEIMPAVAAGKVDVGVIIHESRFTFPTFGLRKVIDLGEWWEAETGQPIPLGGIVARRSLGIDVLRKVEALICASVERAFQHPEEPWPFISRHAQEMSEEVCRAHIGLYVNSYSVNYGDDGAQAIDILMEMAEAKGIIPRTQQPLFI